nr:hypothetical protein [Tanacetum cinerariifolium]
HCSILLHQNDKDSWRDSDDEDDDNDDDVDNDDDAESDDHDDDSDNRKTKSDNEEIPDPNLTKEDHTRYKEEDVDEGVRTPSNKEFTDEEKLDDEETMDYEDDVEVLKEMYEDVNLNMEKGDVDITDANSKVTLPKIPNFAFVFKFDQKVSALETKMSELKQTNQFVEAVSLISTIVNQYLASKMKEAVNVAVQLETNKLREEAQAENQDFLNQANSTIKKIIKNKVKEQVSKMVQILRSIGRDDQDKDKDPSAGLKRGTKRKKSGKDAASSKDSRSKEKKSFSTSKDASQTQHKSSNKSVYAEEPSYTVEELGMQQDQEFVTGDNVEQPADKEVTKDDWFKKLERPPTPNPDWSKRRQIDFRPHQTWITQAARAEEPPTSFDEFNEISFDFSAFVLYRLHIPNLTQEILVGPAFNLLKGTCKSIMKLEYHLEECSKATAEHLDWHNPKNKLYSFDLIKPIPLIQDHRGHQIIPNDYFINKDVKYLKGGDSSRRYSTYVMKTTRVDDLQLVVKSYQNKLNQTKPETYRSNLMNKTAYTSHSDPYGIIYVDSFRRKRLMRTDELHNFSDGTLNNVRSTLYDIAAGIRITYLLMRKCGNLDKKRARVMVHEIDKQLYQRRLMHNLEKFVGGRP